MSFAEFAASLARDPVPPDGLTGALRALWLDGRGDWEAAHAAAQEDETRAGAWVHAYLHRKEGDAGNVGYWYARAGRRRPAGDMTLAQEWELIARALLADGTRK